MEILTRLSDKDLQTADIEGLIRLAKWLKVLPPMEPGPPKLPKDGNLRWWKQTIIRAIQREEKRITHEPKTS